jgi:pyrimidine-nucleoside phosphorylase
MSAWLMAVFLRGMSIAETTALTRAMMNSGKQAKRPQDGPPRIDKHSTGGVGDKISIPLAPLVASCGVVVPMIAGRGLGHTGGTVDKLESIKGYETGFSLKQFDRVLRKVGASIIGQTKDIAPVDRRTYALRDVTGTVASQPLIIASILSKKLAEGLDGLVLDVKVGRGAFMQDLEAGRSLAQGLCSVATSIGTPTVARLTDMSAPLGRTIGNALEIAESIAILKGEGPKDTSELTLLLAEDMLLLAGIETSRPAARRLLLGKIQSGEALARFGNMVEAHGGDPRFIDDPRRLPRARTQSVVDALSDGTVHEIDPLTLAYLALDLGAGRKRAGDKIDPRVGLELHISRGESVQKGQPLLTLHTQGSQPDAAERALTAFSIRKGPRATPELSLGVVKKRKTRGP